MASKRRLRRNGCGHKMRHLNQAAALAHSRSLYHNKGETRLNVYHCKWCGGYHVGHRGMD